MQQSRVNLVQFVFLFKSCVWLGGTQGRSVPAVQDQRHCASKRQEQNGSARTALGSRAGSSAGTQHIPNANVTKVSSGSNSSLCSSGLSDCLSLVSLLFHRLLPRDVRGQRLHEDESIRGVSVRHRVAAVSAEVCLLAVSWSRYQSPGGAPRETRMAAPRRAGAPRHGVQRLPLPGDLPGRCLFAQVPQSQEIRLWPSAPAPGELPQLPKELAWGLQQLEAFCNKACPGVWFCHCAAPPGPRGTPRCLHPSRYWHAWVASLTLRHFWAQNPCPAFLWALAN